jgi:hypothetical protein
VLFLYVKIINNDILFGGNTMKSVRWILTAIAVVSFLAAPAELFAAGIWYGDGSTNLWSEGANWDNYLPPTASDNVYIPWATAPKMPLIDTGTSAVGASVYVGCNWANGTLTQTSGSLNVGHELALGHESFTGTYTISGGELKVTNHILLSDAGTSTGVLEVVGSEPNSITAGYQLLFRNGTGELKFVMDAAGVTHISPYRLILSNSPTKGPRILTVDATAYTGPATDMVLVDYAWWDSGTFTTVNLIGARAESIAYGTVIPNALTVHIAPDPTLMVAQNPSPANGAGGVAQNAVLSWLPGAGFDPASDLHKVYFAAGNSEPNLPSTPTATVSSATFDPALAWATQYVWRVDEVIDGATYTGSVWTFTTTGTRICVPQLLADTNGDCVVDMADLDQMAAEWLDCTLSNGPCP